MKLLPIFASAAIALAAVGSAPAHATIISGSTTGLAGATSTITFDEIVLPTGTLVTNQYAGLGLTINPGLYYSPQTGFGNVQGNDLGNFNFVDPNVFTPQTFSFGSTLNGAAFAVASNNSNYLFEALLGGLVVDSFTANVGTSSADFYGFSGISLDAIRVTDLTADFYLIDNVQQGATVSNGAVPEPATWAMMLLGFGMAGFGLRNRRKPTVSVTYA